jgi:membrane-associated phospholipid phosphatase
MLPVPWRTKDWTIYHAVNVFARHHKVLAHVTFGIAFGIYFVDRRIGRLFLIVAALIAAGRVVVGAHYPADVLAGVVVGAAAAVIAVRVGRPLLYRVVLLLERLTDPLVGGAGTPFQGLEPLVS